MTLNLEWLALYMESTLYTTAYVMEAQFSKFEIKCIVYLLTSLLARRLTILGAHWLVGSATITVKILQLLSLSILVSLTMITF